MFPAEGSFPFHCQEFFSKKKNKNQIVQLVTQPDGPGKLQSSFGNSVQETMRKAQKQPLVGSGGIVQGSKKRWKALTQHYFNIVLLQQIKIANVGIRLDGFP